MPAGTSTANVQLIATSCATCGGLHSFTYAVAKSRYATMDSRNVENERTVC